MLTMPGLDALSDNSALLARLRNQRLGLLTNPTGQTRDGAPARDVLRALNLKVVALFSPEHGPRADREGEIESGHAQGLPLHSLYGATRRPSPAMLDNLDAIIVDLQDVGARFYTYAATMFGLLEACAPRGIALVILDRPNPLGGNNCEGPIIETDLQSFVGPAPLPITHAMTLAELARWFVNTADLNVELLVAPLENWTREMRWPDTKLTWRRPSPNLPDFTSAAWYAGLCPLEFCDFCVGRGTDAPFQILAAPDFPAADFAARWRNSAIQVSEIAVVPTHAKFAGEKCRGVRFWGDSPANPVAFGLEAIATLRATYATWPRADFDKAAQLVGSHAAMDALWNGDLAAALTIARDDGAKWKKQRAPFLLY